MQGAILMYNKTSNKIIVFRTIAAVDDCMNYVIWSFYLEFTESQI